MANKNNLQLDLFEGAPKPKKEKVRHPNKDVQWFLNQDIPFEIKQALAAELMYIQEHGEVPEWTIFK